MARTGYVSLIGRPNAGKSTLLNRIIGEKVAIVSDKPQTTRNRILAVKNYDDGQIVFVDTPGIHRPMHRLNVRMVDTAGTWRRVRLEAARRREDARRSRAEQDRSRRQSEAASIDGAGVDVARVRSHRAGIG